MEIADTLVFLRPKSNILRRFFIIMKHFKKIITASLISAMALSGLTACNSADSSGGSDEKTLSIVTTIFPEYDWVKQILGDKADNAEITMLLDNGVDLHSYQPVASDIAEISACDMFIYVGGESDEWVEDTLKSATNKDMKVINLLETLGDSVKTEVSVEGMQPDEHEHDEDEDSEHEHDEAEDSEHEHDEAEDSGHEHEHNDEHVWLSLKNTEILCSAISEDLAELDSANADTYKKNAAAYITKLSELDVQYQSAADSSTQKTILFGDRFPFRYLADDYSLEYYAAFSGCSAESEASFETITFLSEKVDELGLSTILTLEGSDNKLAETIISNTQNQNQTILSLDSMQSTTSDDVKNGATYLSIMESNLNVLKDALK